MSHIPIVLLPRSRESTAHLALLCTCTSVSTADRSITATTGSVTFTRLPRGVAPVCLLLPLLLLPAPLAFVFIVGFTLPEVLPPLLVEPEPLLGGGLLGSPWRRGNGALTCPFVPLFVLPEAGVLDEVPFPRCCCVCVLCFCCCCCCCFCFCCS